ncbi:UPF0500 protein C1orf216 homolog isoform X2 [Esox lucius]|uniref:Uncharacterized protein n=2 Tax=Esox lucius TaxID=8010 RepID=A0A3P8Z8N8_ESOLU|nr:UPF0500 protein C1orf216 homolog isoform X2 [Esox lucius]XP_019905703.1 UPF0500 protein C1orf216 homolog isoform X2 [Esox lucius]XP_034150495.1 UPF0500 protein C1orf216 homolog isoform X2 [Esox lucius]
MLHQDRPMNPQYGGQLGGSSSLRILSNHSQQQTVSRKPAEKDGNFNFLAQDDDGVTAGDENRNQVRPRNLGPLGRDQPHPPTLASANHYSPGLLSPLSRLPCWSPLEPLPEIESGDDGYGRVPPDGAEEGKMEEEMRRMSDDKKEERELEGGAMKRGAVEDQEDEETEEDLEEWGDSDSEFEFSYRSGGSLSSLNMESGGEGASTGGWDRIGVGEPKPEQHKWGNQGAPAEPPTRPSAREFDDETGRKWAEKPLRTGNSLVDRETLSDSDTDCGELPELQDAVWTLRDRERFKAQEMEKHQVQLTMYRRLALIRWVRTLQGCVQEQQNRLQSSFDVILDHRKELLRMGTATAATATASQS